MERTISGFGILVLLGLAWLLSDNRKKMDVRVIIGGITLQFLLALLILKTDVGQLFFLWSKNFITTVIEMSDAGAEFLFGASYQDHFFAFKVLPTIIFASTLSYVLFYLGILQKVVEALAWVMKKVMNISGAESLVTAANVFIGQTEAPLFIKPYLRTMTSSEVMVMMTGGMATVAGGVLAAYVGFGVSPGHLLAASLMSAPAAIVIAKILCPETESSPTMGSVKVSFKSEDVNIFEAACNGASEGLKLALNVGAMLIAFIALVKLVNVGLGEVGSLLGMDLSLEIILGRLFQPLAFIMGVPWSESYLVGQMLGTKVVTNEFLSFIQLKEYIDGAKVGQLSQRSITICTYAFCGFANFSSIAVQIGGIGALEPHRKQDFARHGFRAMIGGTLAAFMTACIAGVLL